LVFSLTQRDTYEEVVRLRETIFRIKGLDEEDKVPLVIVGNKSDLVDLREVNSEEGEKLATSWGCKYFETSARADTGIDLVFEEIVRYMRVLDMGRKRRSRDAKKRKGMKCVIL